MRKIILFAVFILSGCFAAGAQVSKPVSDDARSSEKIVKGAPFSAEAVTESVQTLSDGTKITRHSASKIYRDNEGRYRREDSKMQLGVPGENIEIPESIKIVDPVSGAKYSLDSRDHTFKQSSFKYESMPDKDFTKAMEKATEKAAKQQEANRKQQAENRKQQEKNAESRIENKADQQAESHSTQESSSESSNTTNGKTGSVIKKPSPPDQTKPQWQPAPGGSDWLKGSNGTPDFSSKQESLGTRTIEGVSAVGTRLTTVIPAGKIGNDRDINVVYERWYSPDLQITVLSRLDDPRLGEQTFRLLKINRENPPLSLFSPPYDYTTKDQPKQSAAQPDDNKSPRAPTAPGKAAAPGKPKPGGPEN